MAAVSEHHEQEELHRTLYWRFNRFLERHLPTDLYRRSLIIVITPMVLLQSIVAGTFIERHWSEVTKSLSKSLAREMSFIVAVYESSARTEADIQNLQALANSRLNIGLRIQPDAELPPPAPRPLFSFLDTRLTRYIARYGKRPFWLDTVGKSGYVDVRMQADDGTVFRFVTNQDRAYVSNTPAFMAWMIGSAIVLLIVAGVFLRNQIKPIQELASAARDFGMGREVADFRPRGASEVQEAASAFINMKQRIESHVEQRTAMLAGVSHDLRTLITRFKLDLAMLGSDPRIAALKGDVDEMQRMLEGYIAFVRGDEGEPVQPCMIGAMAGTVARAAARPACQITVTAGNGVQARVKPDAFKRCLTNLVNNAARFATRVEIALHTDEHDLHVIVDDDGPGIPGAAREEVFRPFVRLDDARNQDETGTGLGLAIARDIARGHGGDITLDTAPLGGLRASVRVPV